MRLAEIWLMPLKCDRDAQVPEVVSRLRNKVENYAVRGFISLRSSCACMHVRMRVILKFSLLRESVAPLVETFR